MRSWFIFAYLLFIAITGFAKNKTIAADGFEIIPLSENMLIHVSYLNDDKFGKVACNGMIYMNGSEAMFVDTPPDDSSTAKLLDWFSFNYPGTRLVGVIVTHFHADCLGGLNEFHRRNIPSYGNNLTAALAMKSNKTAPQKTFEKSCSYLVGDRKIMASYFGEAHTKDNIVVWIKDEKTLFGGCMIKAMNAGKGNLADANEAEWSITVRKVKMFYPGIKKVIPGHGAYGNKKLLDYTIKLFSKN